MPATLIDTRVTRATVASSRQAFVPTRIAGCRLWLAADRILGLASGDPIAAWPDLSGAGNDATQSTGARKPTWQPGQLGGYPVVRFDGVDDLLKRSNPIDIQIGASSVTIVLVGKTTDAVTRQKLFTFNSSEVDFKGFYVVEVLDTNVARSLLDTGSGGVVTSTAAAIGTGYRVLSIVIEYNGANRNFIDGLPDGTEAGHSTDISGANIGYSIGAEWDGASSYNPLAGDIAELLVYNRALSAAELAQVHRYCGGKYGLAVAA